jgi:hypothetical protein
LSIAENVVYGSVFPKFLATAATSFMSIFPIIVNVCPWNAFTEAYRDPSKLDAMKRTGHVPSKETVNWATEETKRLITRLQRAAKDRAKRTSESTLTAKL